MNGAWLILKTKRKVLGLLIGKVFQILEVLDRVVKLADEKS